MSLTWIDEYVNGVIEYCCSRDIYEIYDTLNIIIKRVDEDDLLLQGNEAMYIRNFQGSEIVFIRDDLPYQFTKFILAHELGHAILHAEIVQAAYNSKLLNKGRLEKEADYFALKLLGITFDAVDYEGFTVEQIAAVEKVPTRIIELKFKNLGLF